MYEEIKAIMRLGPFLRDRSGFGGGTRRRQGNKKESEATL
ncbi:hypothetical protein B8V81_4579 [Paenibacillus pasadenensis]|uniref:Uncharacterized protein n=1 Tax=Paenibacillus pasadenensis TaxID=217090 RepID=A0A2N5N738_9BACL|nr:hypothetical protein B8V81_4579 [Paenibacillus pasadenensis]